MKKFRQLTALLAAILLLVSLCACKGGTASSQNAGGKDSGVPAENAGTAETDISVYAREYRFLCGLFSAAYMDSILDYEGEPQEIGDQYVEYQAMMGSTVTLNADGTGYLYWGEENQGKIDAWTMKGNSLAFKAGVSQFQGSIQDGIMTVIIEDGFSLCFVSENADPNQIHPMTPEKYFRLLYGLDSESGENG
ncbi:MAG: hypothetical protein J6P31_06415 [Oscillospiraceae bacterium]|nr:hypothetical protein [Oscillospiraceae bacterium]